MDCGPTCLQMIASYYGKDISSQTLRERTQIGREGANMLGISEAAESLGFRTRALQLSYPLLVREALLPSILYWNQGHFVVLYRISNRRLFVADPAHGLVSFTADEFLQRWVNNKENGGLEEGVALLLEPTRQFYENAQGSPAADEKAGLKKKALAYRRVIGYILPYKKLLFQLLLGLVVSSVLQLLFPFLTQSVIDVGVNSGSIHFVFLVVLAQAALFLGRLVSDVIRNWILLHISTRLNISIMADFLAKMLNLPLAFFDSKRTGDILQRMNDRQRIETFLTGSSVAVLFSLASLLIFSVVLAIFNASIFAIFCAAGVCYAGWAAVFLKYRRTLDYKRFEVAAKEQGITIQLVQGMQEIKLHGMERPMRLGWERIQAKLFSFTKQGLALKQWQQSGAAFINEGKNLFITFVSAKAVIEGHMTLGMLLAVQYIVGQLNSPIDQIIGFLQSWQDARISMERLNEIHRLDDEEPEDRPLSNVIPPHAGIVLSAISFTYPGAGNYPVLQDIHLHIPAGKTTAIVGVSGSGKTTLLKLLLKFYTPQQGQIHLDTLPLSDISHKTWRSHCGVVMQDSFIFSDTIARNIAVGVEAIDRKRLWNAVRIAQVDDLIESLPLGFDTTIGAEGMGISMGQKQRILIARAVYRDPGFIFFDEATNSLDAINESAILRNLESFFTGKTVVVVAHRLSTVKNADQIVVLHKGRIVELGTHPELVKAKGFYFTLVKNQLELGT